ncbi:MAG: hemerythrin domain-containing protein [Melioribacteraceae bacterium]|nr:hemerythrin domain-containing protein [Melioribacteraceae bacterium]
MKKINFIESNIKASDLIFEFPTSLLLMEHFGISFQIHNKTIQELCDEIDLNSNVFITIVNMYNKNAIINSNLYSKKDLIRIISFLKNSHKYYENEKYPEIKKSIDSLYNYNRLPEIKLIGKFFDEYFEEVKEHLNYENDIAFPYFDMILNNKSDSLFKYNFSVKEYSEHHSDIEYKLEDLKELLLNHIPIQNDRLIRRNIIFSLYDLQHHLNVHSEIEDHILVPAIAKFEKELIGK